MKKRIKDFILFMYSSIIGLLLGLLLGLLIFGTVFRLLLDLFLGYGDSGPTWVSCIIISVTLICVFISIRINYAWMKSFIDRRDANPKC